MSEKRCIGAGDVQLDDLDVVVMVRIRTGRPCRGTVHHPRSRSATCRCGDRAPLRPGAPDFRWGTPSWSAVGGLVLLGAGLGVVISSRTCLRAVDDARLRRAAFAAAVALALVVSSARSLGLARLAAIEKLHQRAIDVRRSDDRAESRAVSNASCSSSRIEPATRPRPRGAGERMPARSSTAPT